MFVFCRGGHSDCGVQALVVVPGVGPWGDLLSGLGFGGPGPASDELVLGGGGLRRTTRPVRCPGRCRFFRRIGRSRAARRLRRRLVRCVGRIQPVVAPPAVRWPLDAAAVLIASSAGLRRRVIVGGGEPDHAPRVQVLDGGEEHRAPSAVTCLKSPHHFWLTPVALKSRPRRSAGPHGSCFGWRGPCSCAWGGRTGPGGPSRPPPSSSTPIPRRGGAGRAPWATLRVIVSGWQRRRGWLCVAWPAVVAVF